MSLFPSPNIFAFLQERRFIEQIILPPEEVGISSLNIGFVQRGGGKSRQENS
jgi:hypothetical protein